MKRMLYLLIVVALAGILPAGVLGQSGITWDSEIFVQNVGTDVAYVTIYYYENAATAATANPLWDEDYTIPVGESIRFYPTLPGGVTSFNGSAVIESTEPIIVLTNQEGNFPDFNGAYEGFALGSDTVYLPAIMSCNAGYYTFFNVQNTGGAATTVTVEFTPKPGKPAKANETCNLDPGEACTFTQEPGSGASWPACAPGGGWVGGVKVTTDGQPVVAAANQVSTNAANGMGSYSGFAGGATTSALVLGVMNANQAFWSGIAATNAGAAPTNITFKFYPVPGKAAIPDETFTNVAPDDTVNLLMPNVIGTTQWVGAVEVDGNGGQIFVMSNVLRANPQVQLSSYKGIDPAAATDTIALPAVLSNDPTHPWWTGVQIFNTGAAQTTVDIVYSTCPASYCGAAWTPTATVKTIQSWQAANDFHAGGQWDGKYYFGNAIITSRDGAGLIATVNGLGAGLELDGDVTFTYNAINR